MSSDSVAELALDISPELVAKLRGEINATYRLGSSPEEMSDNFYTTACPEMVDNCVREWRSGSQDSALTQLLKIVVESVPHWCKNINMHGSLLPPQIAVRSSDDKFVSRPHLDGLIKGKETETPNVPFGVIGVYLDRVTGKDDGALVYWATRAASVKAAITSSAGKQLAKTLCEIGDACDFSDDDAHEIVGKPGFAYFVGGNVPHCNHSRSAEGRRIAVYFRLYEKPAAAS